MQKVTETYRPELIKRGGTLNFRNKRKDSGRDLVRNTETFEEELDGVNNIRFDDIPAAVKEGPSKTISAGSATFREVTDGLSDFLFLRHGSEHECMIFSSWEIEGTISSKYPSSGIAEKLPRRS